MNIKIRLSVFIFLEFAVWGAWLISLGAYLGAGLGFSGWQIGSVFATMGLASLFMPGLAGMVADRWVPAEKLLGICHLAAAGLLVLAASQTSYMPFYACILAAMCFYMPSIALMNSVSYGLLNKFSLDPAKHFPPVRVWGTVGFIAAMWAVDLLSVGGVPLKQTAWQLYLSAALGVVMFFYTLTLPSCGVSRIVTASSSWVDRLGLRAFTLFRERRIAVFFLFSMLLGAALQITNAFGDAYIQSFGKVAAFADTFVVKHSVILLSLSQASETFCILLIPFFLRRFGIKRVMLISMGAWVLRFGFFALGDPTALGTILLVLSMLVYGVGFDFFNISGSLYVERKAPAAIRSSAQGVFMIMNNGIGACLGSYAAGAVVDAFGWPNSWYIFAGYALAVGIAFMFAFKEGE